MMRNIQLALTTLFYILVLFFFIKLFWKFIYFSDLRTEKSSRFTLPRTDEYFGCWRHITVKGIYNTLVK